MIINKRVWLNNEDSPSTGSIVVYHGPSNYPSSDGQEITVSFVEVADCHSKVRLHQTHKDTDEQFIEKVKLMRDTLTYFIQKLELERSKK